MSCRWALAAILCLACGFAAAHEAGAPFADWFMSRKQPDAPNVSCCGVADAYDVERVEADPKVAGGFRALVNGEWMSVPPWKVDWESVNPTGRAVIFLERSENGYPRWVACFIPAAGV